MFPFFHFSVSSTKAPARRSRRRPRLVDARRRRTSRRARRRPRRARARRARPRRAGPPRRGTPPRARSRTNPRRASVGMAFFLSIAPTSRATRRPSRVRPVGAPRRLGRARAPTPRPVRRDGFGRAVGAGRPLSSLERRGRGPAREVRRGPSRARNSPLPASARRRHPSRPSSRSPVASRGYARARRVSGRLGPHAGPPVTSAPASSTDSRKGTAGADSGLSGRPP